MPPAVPGLGHAGLGGPASGRALLQASKMPSVGPLPVCEVDMLYRILDANEQNFTGVFTVVNNREASAGRLAAAAAAAVAQLGLQGGGSRAVAHMGLRGASRAARGWSCDHRVRRRRLTRGPRAPLRRRRWTWGTGRSSTGTPTTGASS
jgi:hypothetical protein